MRPVSPSHAIDLRKRGAAIAVMTLFAAACAVMSTFASRAQAADLFPQKSLNASQQAKVARAISQTRQLRSDGYSQSVERNARGQATIGNNSNPNDRSCKNDAANIEIPKGHRGKIDNTTVVKGDLIMVCRTR